MNIRLCSVVPRWISMDHCW